MKRAASSHALKTSASEIALPPAHFRAAGIRSANARTAAAACRRITSGAAPRFHSKKRTRSYSHDALTQGAPAAVKVHVSNFCRPCSAIWRPMAKCVQKSLLLIVRMPSAATTARPRTIRNHALLDKEFEFMCSSSYFLSRMFRACCTSSPICFFRAPRVSKRRAARIHSMNSTSISAP